MGKKEKRKWVVIFKYLLKFISDVPLRTGPDEGGGNSQGGIQPSLSLSLARATGVLLQRVFSPTTAFPPLFIHSSTHSFSEHLFISFTFLTIRIKPGAYELGSEETHSLKHFLFRVSNSKLSFHLSF
jgi:hypothetical protein